MALDPVSTSPGDRVAIEIHSNNPREGPGDIQSTRRAFSLLSDLPASPQILDVGCGPGMQTIELAQLSHGTVTALDLHEPFLRDLERRAEIAGVSERVKPLHGRMDSITAPDESFDVLWSEGAIYIIGFEEGLKQWRRLLVKDGWLVASHLSWLTSDVPKEPKVFWEESYPAITTIDRNLAIAEALGYETRAHFTLPPEGWWSYYQPIESKLDSLRQRYSGSEEALRRIEATQREIDLYRNYSDYYGYVFYILRKR